VTDVRENRATLDLDEPLAVRNAQALGHGGTRKQRFERALEVLVSHVGGGRAQLYEHIGGALQLRAGEGDDVQLRARATAELERFTREEEATVASSTTDARSDVETAVRVQVGRRCFVIAAQGARPVAVACIEQARRPLREPAPALLQALARALSEPDTAASPAR